MLKKARSHRHKISLLRRTQSFFLVAITACIVPGDAPTPLARAEVSRVEMSCGRSAEIKIYLPSSFEQLALNYPSVICAFRNKGTGFPTLNVVLNPPQPGSLRPSVGALQALVRNEYEKVGLTDADVSEAHMEPLGTLETFHATVRYMNQGMPVEALVMIAILPDRTYTITLLDRADHPLFAKSELEEVLRGISIRGATDAPESVPPPPDSSAIWAIVGGMILIGAALLWRRAHTKSSR